MPVQITIRGVPDEVRDELASRAARQGQSMQQYLRGELERIASKPDAETWLRKVRERKAASESTVTTEQILRHRHADLR